MQSKVTQEDFVRLPYNRDAADGSIRPSQSYWRSVLRRLVKNRVAMVSASTMASGPEPTSSMISVM